MFSHLFTYTMFLAQALHYIKIGISFKFYSIDDLWGHVV